MVFIPFAFCTSEWCLLGCRRRGEKVQILLPLFQDENTLKVFASQNEHEEKVREGDGGSDTDSPQVGTGMYEGRQ